MPHNPVQIVLNSRNFFAIPDKPPGGSAKDFFAGRDPEFILHKARLQRQLATVDSAFQKSGVKAGFVEISKNMPVRISEAVLGALVLMFDTAMIRSRLETVNVAVALRITPFSLLTLVGALPV